MTKKISIKLTGTGFGTIWIIINCQTTEIEDAVVSGYKKIEDGVVSGYKKIEEGAVEGFNKVSDKFVEKFFAKDGETVSEAKARLSGDKKEDTEA